MTTTRMVEKDHSYYYQQGYHLFNLKKFDEAKRTFELVMEIKPSFYLFYLCAKMFFPMKEYTKAIVMLDHYVRINPVYHRIFFYKGFSSFLLNTREKTYNFLKRSIDLANFYNNSIKKEHSIMFSNFIPNSGKDKELTKKLEEIAEGIQELKNEREEPQKKISQLEKKISQLEEELANYKKINKKHEQEIVFLQEKSTEKKEKTSEEIYNETLINATKTGNFSALKTALKLGANINIKDYTGHTLLQLAVINDHDGIIDFLLEKNPHLFLATNDSGVTPIEYLAQSNDLDKLSKLYTKGRSIKEFSDDPEVFNRLWDIACLPAKEMLVKNRLLDACKIDKLAEVKDAIGKIEEIEGDINFKGEDGFTALHTAIFYGHADITLYLIAKGADPTIYNNKVEQEEMLSQNRYETALELAITKDLTELVPNIATAFLIISAFRGNVEGIKFALQKGADFQGKDKIGDTALHKAMYSKNISVIKFLLEIYADKNISIYVRNNHGMTPYDLAVEFKTLIVTEKKKEKELAIYLLEQWGFYSKFYKKARKQGFSPTFGSSEFSFVRQFSNNNIVNLDQNPLKDDYNQSNNSPLVKKL